MPAKLTPVATLPGGSNTLHFSGLTPNAQYTINVAHLEPAPAVGYTPVQAITITTGAGTATAEDPDDPIPFCLMMKQGLWMCGCAAWQNELVPGTCLVWNEAVETAPGSNAFGAFAEVYRVLVEPSTWGVYLEYLPVDGKRRMYEVYADRPGVIPSAMSPVVMVNPGVPLAPQDYAVAVPAVTFNEAPSAAPGINSTALIATYVTPDDHQFDHMEYVVSTPLPAGGTQTQTVVGASNAGQGVTQNDTIITLPPGTTGTVTYNIIPVTVTSGANAGAFLPLLPIIPTRNPGAGATVQVTPLPNQPNVTWGLSGGTVTFSVDFTNAQGTAYVSMYAVDYGTTAPSPVPDTVEGATVPATGASSFVMNISPPGGAGNVFNKSIPLASGHYMVATFVPFNSAGQRGSYTTTPLLTGVGTGGLAAPTVALATFPGPGGGNWNLPNWVGITVTWATGLLVAGDTITLYRDAVSWSSHNITSAEATALSATVLDTGSSAAGQVKNYSASLTHYVAGGNQVSPQSTAVSVTIRAGYTLPAPTFGFGALLAAPSPRIPPGGGNGGSHHFWLTAPSTYAYPPNAQGDIQVGLALGALNDFGLSPVGTHVQAFYPGYPTTGTFYVKGYVQATGYTTSTTSSTTYPYP